MKKLLLGLVVLPLMASVSTSYADTNPAPAPSAQAVSNDESAIRADHPDAYTVVKGDTLWSISGRFLSKPWMWKKLWHMNPNIKNPDLIYPGDTIKLVYVDGKPMLTVDRGDGANTANAGEAGCAGAVTEKKMSDGTVKMSPKCRSLSMEEAIPAISLESIGPFLSENRVVNSDDLIVSAPYIIASERVTGGQGDMLYARGKFDPAISVYDIFRVGSEFKDPETKEDLGLVLRSMGQGKVISQPDDADVVKVELLRTSQEVLTGDKLIPGEETKLASYFTPQEPEKPVSGYILDVLSGVAEIGQYNIVLISKGERDGLKPGVVLAVYHETGIAKDPVTKEQVKLPPNRSGLLMVFRTFEKLSYGIVLQTDIPLAVMDQVKNP